MTIAATAREALVRKALRLEYLTVGWNVIEAGVALASGIAAGSIALVGFGLDSVIEVIAAGALIWRLKKFTLNDEEHGYAEKIALLVVGITFFLLAIYVTYESARSLWFQEAPKGSIVGIVLAIISAALMPALGLMKRRVAQEIGSKALAADAMETLVCAYLSVTLLLGLGLNALWGWWWADPAAGLAMLPLIVHEGWDALRDARGHEH